MVVYSSSSSHDDSSPNSLAEKYRELSHSIASQFSPTEFNPLPSLTNCHIQTIAGVYLRKSDSCKYVKDSNVAASLFPDFFASPDQGEFYDSRQRFETSDNDFFDVDFKFSNRETKKPSSKGMVIVLHGLQSNSQSSLCLDMATAYLKNGFDVACMNFRGCSGEMNRKMGGYHLGFTDDVKQFLGHLKKDQEEIYPTAAAAPPLFLSGFSLGSNVVLKCLGELGEAAHRDFNVYGAAVCGAPFDQERNINFVQAPGFNRLVYMNFLLKSLKERSLQQLELFEGSQEWEKVDYEKVANAKSIADIENAVLAPIYGFRDNIDYYRRSSCLRFLDNITIPTLIVNAADDPFFDPDPDAFPWHRSSDCDGSSPIRMVRTDHGGHLGFMFHQELRTAWNESSSKCYESKERASWMPSELSRFLNSVLEHREKLDSLKSLVSGKASIASVR